MPTAYRRPFFFVPERIINLNYNTYTMKRQTLLKSTLCLLMALVCNVAWAQPKASPAPVDGQWAEGTVWYQIKTKSGFYLRGDNLDANGNVQLPSTSTLDNAALWCVVGDAANGYTFYNKAVGADKALCMNTTTTRAQFVASGTDGYTVTFDFVASQKTDASNTYWCVRKHTGSDNNYYWNPQGDPKQLTYWNSSGATNDNGSAFLFTEVVVLPYFSTEENPKWFSVEFKTGGHFLTDKGNGNVLVTAAAADSDEEYWMFIGDQFSGFKMKSRKGNYVYFESDRFKTTNDAAKAATLTLVAGASADTWELQRDGSSKCMNQNGGTGVGVQLGEWNKGDGNNPFYLNEVEIFEHFIEPVFSDANNEHWFMIRFANGGNHLASNGAGDKAITAAIRNVSSQWWKFVGTAENFQLVSKNGRYATIKSGTATNGQTGNLLHMVSEPDSKGFKIIESANTKYPGSYEIIWNGESGKSFNQWGGTGAGNSVGLWNISSDGNPLYIYMPSPDLLSPFDIEGIASYTPASPLTLWYKNAASNMEVSDQWMEYSLPIGNGQFGASIFGGVAREEVQFNEKTLWSGTKNDYATSEYGDYENFGSVYIQDISEVFGEGKPVKDYYRQLDLSNATASVHYKSTDGNISFTREYIASYPDKVVAMRLKADKEKQISIKVTMAAGRPGLRATTSYANGTATFGGKLETISYNALVKVVPTGGTMTTDAKGITVTGADEVLIILGGATDYDPKNANYVSGTANLPTLVADRVNAAAAKSWSTLYAAHVEDHKSFFDRCDFVLDGAENTMPTDELIREYAKRSTGTESYALMLEQLYFAYGRYLEIGSSRGVDLPANLQGIWNNSSEPAWNSDIHANINVQMNYWPAEPTNLSELHMPFLNYIINMSESAEWKDIATNKAGQSRGWAFLTENNIFGGTGSFMPGAYINNAWYVSHLWQHYRYTLDKEFLERAFPAMWGAAMFWMDRLKLADDGTYVCPNEFSPEHGPTEDGVAHAQQLVWELFSNTLSAAEILGQDGIDALAAEYKNVFTQDLATLQDRFAKLDKGLTIEKYTPNGDTGAWGEGAIAYGSDLLREWKYSNYYAGANGHRHMSHMMCLYPFNQLTAGTDLFNAAINSMKLRGDASTGWSMGWKINLWARALDGDHSHDILELALRHHSVSGGGVYYNLYDSHAPFQIDGNFGACAGIAEMLFQSHTDVLDILPALPSVWKKGAIKGLKAVGNFTVDIEWENSLAQKVTITSHKGAPLRVRSNHGAMDIAKAKITVNGVEVNATVENGIATIPCNQDEKVVIDFTTLKTVVYTVSGKTGAFNDDNANSNWEKVWTFTKNEAQPAPLQFTTGANNMDATATGNTMLIAPGGSQSSTYSLTVPFPFLIKGYSFHCDGPDDGNQKITIDGTEYPVKDGADIEVTGLSARTASFVLSGTNVSVEVTNFKVYITTDPSFEYADSYENITKWYYMQMHSNNKKYIEYIPDGNYLEWVDGNLPTTGSTSAHAWAFIGDLFNGFKLYNRSAGAMISVKSTGNGNPTMAADGTAFLLAASTETGNGYFCLQYPGGNYLNAQNGKVAHWHANDAGSTILLTEVVEDPNLVPLREAAFTEMAANALGNTVGTYAYNVGSKRYYTLDAIRIALRDADTEEKIEEIRTSYSLNMPLPGEYFRVAYDYGDGVGNLYMQSTASSVKGLAFTADKDTASIWQYRDGGLYSYTAGQCLREVDNDRGLSDTKTNATFSASTRAAGKYNIACTSYVHANKSGNNYFTDHCSGNNCNEHDFILEAVEPTIMVTIGNLGYSTLYSEVALSIPAGITAYTGSLKGEWLILTPINSGAIPAKTAVILEGSAGSYGFFEVTTETTINNNILRGTADNIPVSSVTDGVVYTLQPNGEGGVVFMQYTGETLNANKAYLVLDGNVAQSISIRFEGTTDIEHSEIRNQHSEIIYDLQGRRVLNPTKGIYIVNGKKIIK